MIISKELVEYSLRAMIHRKTRSILTIISIMIGITAIFLFVSFGIGLYNYVGQFTTSSSVDKIMISPKGFGGSPISEDVFLSKQDLNAVLHTPGVYDATGVYYKAAEIKQDKIKKYVFLIAYDPQKPIILEINSIKIYQGRELKKDDTGKVVLGYNYLLDKKIFTKPYELNSPIIIDGRSLKVVGFYEPVGNPSDDSQIYMTNQYYESLYGNQTKGYSMIVAKVDVSKIKTVVADVESSLRKSRNEKVGKEDFTVQSFEDLIKTYQTVLNGIIGFVILIALISVLVSAINTSNTMITSVLERIKEIGIMKSVGARNSEILKIFIFESGFLGFVAGMLGVVLGFLISSSLGGIIKTAGWGFLAPAFPIYLFLGCIIFATLTGALSGIIPAIRASRINPVQALRYE